MTIPLLNALSIGFLLMTVTVLVVRRLRGRLANTSGRMIVFPFVFLILASLTNLVQHLGISELPENWEDILGILFFPFLIFSIQTTLIRKELRRAEESDRLKSTFLANLSHEIRTPLNGIVGFCDLLKDETTSRVEAREYAGLLGISSARFLRLMDNLILLSRMETEPIEVKNAPIDAGALIRELAEEIRISAERKGIDLRVSGEPAGEGGIVHTDRASLAIILGHLFENALKFTDRGGIRIQWRRDGNGLRVMVEDTGRGMSDEEIRKAFERFGRMDTGRESAHDGMGMGLPIARKLARSLGGDIVVESTPGKGSIFTVTIPE